MMEGMEVPMQRLLLSGFLCCIAVLPAAADARDGLQMAALSDAPQVEVVDSFEVLAVGAGILIGAAAGYFLVPVSAGTLVGAIAGGIVGDWWYKQEADDYRLLLRRTIQ
jgi:uncharacterized membrane protein YczE